MTQALELPSHDMSVEKAVEHTIRVLTHIGLNVMQSFDLQAARADHLRCGCPYHGTASCNCQMVVLLVYGSETTPTTLVLHGRDGGATLFLVDTPEQHPAAGVPELIRQALLAKAPAS